MNLTSPSMQLTAKEFWQNCQWLGSKTFNHNRQRANISDWHVSLVQELFANANWSGKNSSQSLPKDLHKQLEISLPVQEFFQCFAWQKQQKSTATKNIIVSQNFKNPEKQATLSELSQLF